MTSGPDLGVTGPLGACLARLDVAIDAAATLGLDVSDAVGVREMARERLRFPGATYVLALAGGTGVGKSSLLNSLAGGDVSTAGARRPTTGEPVAWVPAATRRELEPVLEWLGVRRIHEHAGEAFSTVAVLDLPDLDSVAAEHRARVDALLPRVDAVAWVADPEKYQDAILHDAYLRSWGPRLARQAVVLNKADRLSADDAERLRRDLAGRLRADGLPGVPVLLTAAVSDGAAPVGPDPGLHGDTGRSPGVAEFRRWLGEDVAAKRIVAARVAAGSRSAIAGLAATAGVAPGSGDERPTPRPIVSDEQRSQALRDVAREVFRVVDMPGLERQAVQATRVTARPRAGGPVARLWDRLYRVSGRAEATADPAAHLRRWRQRGSLTRAVEPIRRLVTDALPTLPPAARRAVVTVADPEALTQRLSEAIDAAVVGHASREDVPTSRVWPLVASLQFLATGALVFGIVWLVALWALGSGGVTTTEVPVLGPVPQPVLLVAGSLLAGFLLGRIVDVHARWLGRRWAGRLRRAVSDEIEGRVGPNVLRPLDAIDAARQRLAEAAEGARRDCDAAVGAEPRGSTSRGA